MMALEAEAQLQLHTSIFLFPLSSSSFLFGPLSVHRLWLVCGLLGAEIFID